MKARLASLVFLPAILAGAEASASNLSALPFTPLPPCRLVDTRGGGAPLSGGFLPPATVRSYAVGGLCGIPANAQAVSLNATVTNATGSGFLILWAQGNGFPPVSTLNFVLGQTIANAAVVPLGTQGGISAALGVSGADVILDTNGYYSPVPAVSSVNGLSGDLTLAAGTGIVLGQAGQQLTIGTTGTGGVVHDGSLTGDGAATPLSVAFSGSGFLSKSARADHDHDVRYQTRYVRTVVVSPVGTPAENGDALRNALAGITTATASNPWLVKIEPGIYDIRFQTISMVPFVDVEGSGEDVTTITGGPYYFNGATLWTAPGELRFLTVESYGGAGTDATAVYNPGPSARLLHVTLRASGGTRSIGMWSVGGAFDNYSNVSAKHVTVSATGSGANYAVFNHPYVKLDLEDVSASAGTSTSGGVALYLWSDSVRLSRVSARAVGTSALGWYCERSDVTARDVDASADGEQATAFFNTHAIVDLTNARGTAASSATFSRGFYNHNTTLTCRSCVIAASGGVASTGIYGELSGEPGPILFLHSSVSGGTNSLINPVGTTVRFAATQITGPLANAGTVTCAAVFDATLAFYPSTCP